jgi:hypothetical protein
MGRSQDPLVDKVCWRQRLQKGIKEARDWIGALIMLFFVIGGAGFVFIVETIMKIEPVSRQLGRSNLSKKKVPHPVRLWWNERRRTT